MQSEYDFYIQLLPITIMWLIFLIPTYKIARRKDISTPMMLLGMFPIWIGLFALWWASLPDKELLERISRLEGSANR